MLWRAYSGTQNMANMSIATALGWVMLGKRCIKGVNRQKEEINLSLGIDSINSDISELSCEIINSIKVSIQIKI